MLTEDRTMYGGMDPSTMTGQDRLAEVGMLLALAMMRLWLKRRGGAAGPAPGQRGLSRGSPDNRLELSRETPLSVSVDQNKE